MEGIGRRQSGVARFLWKELQCTACLPCPPGKGDTRAAWSSGIAGELSGGSQYVLLRGIAQRELKAGTCLRLAGQRFAGELHGMDQAFQNLSCIFWMTSGYKMLHWVTSGREEGGIWRG